MNCFVRLATSAIIALFFGVSAPARAGEECQPLTWPMIGPGEQTFELRDRIELDDGRYVIGVEFGELTGYYAKVALFIEFDKSDCERRVISHGSYAYLLEVLEPGEERSFHLDLYEPGMHSTLDMGGPRMSYEEVREAALGYFEDRVRE